MSSNTSLTSSSSPSFHNRRGNLKFSSAKFTSTTRSKKSAGLLSFRSSRRAAPRPTRVKGVFESVLHGLNDGIGMVKQNTDNLKLQLPSSSSNDEQSSNRQHYYMELEKNVKTLERKIRSLEVLRDRIEELRDDYMLKLKLKDGAFNLAQALANRPSKYTKEKLLEARTEAKQLSDDLCDIEEELETKLGVFNVHINGFSSLPRTIINGEVIEVQFKLSSQKWKARCKIGRHQNQLWLDNDIFFLCKVTDELSLKVVEVKRIQGNNYIGSMKCQSREFFSFLPQVVVFTLPSIQNIKLDMEIRWSPIIGDDFLTDLDLKPLYCYVGCVTSIISPNKLSNISKTQTKMSQDKERKKSKEEMVEKLLLHTKTPELSPSHTSTNSSYQRRKEKLQKVRPKSTSDLTGKRILMEPDILAIQSNTDMLESSLSQPYRCERSASPDHRYYRSKSAGSRSAALISLSRGSLTQNDSNTSSECDTLTRVQSTKTSQNISLSSLVDSVLNSIEELSELYQELKLLESQLLRLQTALRGGSLIKAPSVTLSESNALDSFDFLDSTNEDYMYAEMQLSQISEGFKTGSFSDFISLQNTPEDDDTLYKANSDSLGLSSPTNITYKSISKDTTGYPQIDIVLLQHLLHCEYLLQHLQAVGPLKHKLVTGLKKIYKETEIIRELLNYVADIDTMPKLEKMLPELASCDHLFKFWKQVSGQDNDNLCVSCELFVIALDEKYGQILWNEFPEIANKVFSELLNRVLDLEGDECDPVENKLSVTVYQFVDYFSKVGGSKQIPKALIEIAQELSITEGIRNGDTESKQRVMLLLPTYPFNYGALLAAAYLITDEEQSPSHDAAVTYLNNFTGNSPWRTKAIQYYIEALENSDQTVRTGSCLALGQLKAEIAASQLKYLSEADFSPVRMAATKALDELGQNCLLLKESPLNSKLVMSSTASKSLHRTRSAECIMPIDSNEHRTII